MAAALNRQDESSQLEQPCDHGSENRNSDLCAQWKAADAAQSGSDASWLFGWIGTVLGLLTLAAAGAAAWYAKRAADETQRSAKAAEETLALGVRTAAADLRPYLFIDRFEAEWNEEGVISLFRVPIIFRNYGKLPARSIEISAHCYITDDISILKTDVLRDDPIRVPVCAPGHERRAFVGTYTSQSGIESLRSGDKVIVLRVRYRYKGNGRKVFAERADYIYDSHSFGTGLFYVLTDSSRKRRAERMKDLVSLMRDQEHEDEE